MNAGLKPRAEITVRARRDEDIPALVKIRNLPRVRWGTLGVPYESVDRIRKRLAATAAALQRSLVACGGDEIVGEAGVFVKPMPRIAHAASIGIMVHDDWQNCGVGSALFKALTDVADNWMGLRRLELHVYTDNAAALALYKKFGFEIEATEIADAFRDGAFVDSYIMGRLRGGGGARCVGLSGIAGTCTGWAVYSARQRAGGFGGDCRGDGSADCAAWDASPAVYRG
jgi:putative acetyltransferase